MSKFKEIKKGIIDSNKEKGDVALEKGQERLSELQDVKALIDSLELEDDSDAELIESLNDSYLEAGKDTFNTEVQEVVNDVNQNLESNKNEITAEKTNVEGAAGKVAEMQNITDMAKSSASTVEGSLKSSIGEYQGLENETETVETNLSTTAQNILSAIESLF